MHAGQNSALNASPLDAPLAFELKVIQYKPRSILQAIVCGLLLVASHVDREMCHSRTCIKGKTQTCEGGIDEPLSIVVL
jgi:hypothetical protein